MPGGSFCRYVWKCVLLCDITYLKSKSAQLYLPNIINLTIYVPYLFPLIPLDWGTISLEH